MSPQAVASIKASDGPGNYCLNVLSSLSLSDKEKLSLVIGDSLITFNKHVVCSLSPLISDILKDECCCLKDHVFISLPDETSLRGFICLKAVLETGATHELAINNKDELYVAIKLLGMDIQLETIVQENIDNVASAECHKELEESVNVVNVSSIDIDEDFIQTETVNECISDMVGSDAQQHESIVSTEDMFAHNVEMESEQTTPVVGMDGDDTNSNTTIQPRTNNVMEEIQVANNDLEVLEEINMGNSMENAQRNLNTKPVLKECEVRINRISRKSFGMMRNCCVKIKRLDRKFDKALKYLKCSDTISQEFHRETRRNPKQRILPSRTSAGDGGSCVPQAASSGGSCVPQASSSGGSCVPQASSSGGSCVPQASSSGGSCIPQASSSGGSCIPQASSSGGSCAPQAASSGGSCVPQASSSGGSCVPQASSSGAPSQPDLHMHIDVNNALERSHSNVILHSDNCDEFFSSIGQAHSTSDGEATPSHAHSSGDCQDTSNHAHSSGDCQDNSNHAHSTGDCQDTSNHAHSAADLKETPSHAYFTSDDEATPSHAQPSTHFLSPIIVPKRSNPPQFDGHISEMDDVNTEEEGVAFIEEINTNRRAFDCLAKTVTKTSSSKRICLLTELANTDDVNTDGSDLDRDNMEIDTNVRIERSREDDTMCRTELISNISSLNAKHKNKIDPKTSSSKRICLLSEWVNREDVDDNEFDIDRDKMSDIIDVTDERAPGDTSICPTNFSSNEYQQSKLIRKRSSSDKICFLKESLKNNKEIDDYGTLDLDFENQERDLFDIIEDGASKGKQIPSASNVSSNSLPQEYHGPVEKEIFMEVDNGDFENGQNIHDGRLTSTLPSEFDTEVASVSTPSLLGCSKSPKNHVELSDVEDNVEKQIELVPKIKIKRNLIQWAFEFDSDSFLTPPRKTSKRLNVGIDDDIENQVEESPKNTAKIKSQKWKPYSKEEDKNIVQYMKENNMTGRQRGRRNWQIMEEENVCPGRTWQSMKERWIKRIERKLINISSENENE